MRTGKGSQGVSPLLFCNGRWGITVCVTTSYREGEREQKMVTIRLYNERQGSCSLIHNIK